MKIVNNLPKNIPLSDISNSFYETVPTVFYAYTIGKLVIFSFSLNVTVTSTTSQTANVLKENFPSGITPICTYRGAVGTTDTFGNIEACLNPDGKLVIRSSSTVTDVPFIFGGCYVKI